MKIQFHAPFTINEFTKSLIIEKIRSLEKLDLRFSEADVYFKLKDGKSPVKDKELELKVHVPRKVLFANSFAKTFEEAIPDVFGKIRRQIVKYKSALESKR